MAKDLETGELSMWALCDYKVLIKETDPSQEI